VYFAHCSDCVSPQTNYVQAVLPIYLLEYFGGDVLYFLLYRRALSRGEFKQVRRIPYINIGFLSIILVGGSNLIRILVNSLGEEPVHALRNLRRGAGVPRFARSTHLPEPQADDSHADPRNAVQHFSSSNTLVR